MEYEKLQALPDWVREVHRACEALNDAALQVPAESYPDVKDLRDRAEALWLSQAGSPRIVGPA